MEENNFKQKLDQFIKYSQNVNDNSLIKNEYFKLVKEYMIIINYAYENLIYNKNNFTLIKEDEYEKYKINGKYIFVNEYKRKYFR